MLRFLAKRAAEAVGTVVASSIVIFFGMYLAPGDPVSFVAGNRTLSPAAEAAIRQQFHLDEPLFTRWFSWLSDLARGQFGTSIVYRDDVANLLVPRLATTGTLVTYSVLVIAMVGTSLGLAAALGRRRTSDVILGATSVGVAIPSFVAAMVLIATFAVGLGWFPAFGSGDGFWDRLRHLTLPVIALSLSSASYVARVSRAAFSAELAASHVETATVRGLPRAGTIRRHVVRNAATPLATVIGLTAVSLIVGAAVVERAFALDGVGFLLVDAVAKRDFAVVQAICLLLVVTVVVVITVIDVIQYCADPRLRSNGRARRARTGGH